MYFMYTKGEICFKGLPCAMLGLAGQESAGQMETEVERRVDITILCLKTVS